ncbi:sodium/calcium exchanger 2 isoform X6 [Patella vulgata]|uniref:sodium/calcium exchanger 2 isoform X6 n=1 Tax=Patella vulgata TaxID=6465 RepID=UPI0021800072|nr:sodium/calcium exchanger 2 isoform X6 [Patella vulgata]
MYHFTNFSRGYVAEFFVNESDICKSWLLLPAENLWPEWLRGVLYIAALIYLFMGIAIASDVFMCSIEVITSKKRIISYYDNEKGQNVEREVLLWNETVANLTLMALGSSAPEILLATIETVINLGSEKQEDALGTFTIIGSAAFNLLIITAICVVSVDSPDIKKIRELGVFVLTSIWSIWAYVWMLLVVSYITPGVVTLWEAWVTLAFFPIFVIMAYLQDHGWSCAKKVEGIENEDDDSGIRIVDMNRHGSLTGHVPKELQVLEQERAHRMSIASLNLDKESTENVNGHGPSTHRVAVRKASNEPQVFARARFRHAAVSALMGGTVSHTSHSHSKLPHLVDVVAKMRILNEASKLGKAPEALERQILVSQKFEGDLTGKFTFASDRYAVLESAGMLEVDVLFHRHILSRGKLSIMNETVTYKNGDIHSGETEGVEMVKGVVSVDFETREGSAKPGKDYKYTTGTLIFKENEYKRTLLIPIINDNQYEADVDFYVILKNPKGGGGLGDPSVSRVTIVDDDEPGEFLFEEPHYQADMKKGQVTVKVMREHGYDGKVTIEYSTIDGTAHGGERLKPGVDYIVANGTINFSHSETSKTFSIPVNKDSKGALNFIIALRNPSLGAKIGERSATVCHINKDELIERLAEVLEDEEEKEVTWGSQFANAMTVGGDTDSEGNEVDPKWSHYLMHFFTFFWKLLCALIPPTNCLGAWPTFVFSLTVIAVLTAFVEQLGHLIGCVIGLRTSVTGITIIALGTSVPDTFASRTAAKQDTHADAAIGNVTGSNSVNVFLGLGLPWVIATVYAAISGTEYQVKTTNLTESVIIFSTCGTICIILLLLRRVFVGGELGGKDKIVKYASSIFLIGLWVIYILLASLVAYDYNIIPLPK